MIRQVGITGGIGSGKSVVCRIFKTLGIAIYDADSRAKELMTTDGILIHEIKKEFGNLSYHPDGKLDRSFLARMVFQDDARLKKLNELVHPRVAIDYQHWVEDQKSPYVIREAALLYETGADKLVDFMMVVSAPESVRVARVLKRDVHRTEADVKAIMARQMPEEEKIKRADAVIINDDRQALLPQVLKLHERLLCGN
jgi:dephospho-CoA kinase